MTPWRRLASCRSTNDEAAAWARAGAPHGAVVIADAQTAGRGRLGRSWHALGRSLYFSIVLRPPLPPHRTPPLTLAAGVAVAETIEALGARARLKWPNDLLLEGRKVAGILAEMSTSSAALSFVVVGVGVNLDEGAFPEELADRATSLARHLGRVVDRDAFAADLAERIVSWCARLVGEGPAPIVAAWKERAAFLGREVTVATTSVLRGIAEDVDGEGALLLRLPDGRLERVLAGELQPIAGEA